MLKKLLQLFFSRRIKNVKQGIIFSYLEKLMQVYNDELTFSTFYRFLIIKAVQRVFRFRMFDINVSDVCK